VTTPEPRRFGRYELHEELGRGGMGVVYRAVALDTGREVALKVIHVTAAIDPKDLKRFEREARFAARLRHPGIVGVLDAGSERGLPFVAFELVRGEPLSRLTLDLRRHVQILAKVARAVGAAHKSQIVHRDLKPQNILVDGGTGEPCVVDFGLAFDGRFELSRLSATGEILGTPAYMAPETVLERADPQDPRLDVYALGVMLYERLNGGHPFKGLSLHETLERVVRGFPSLATRPGVDRALARIAERALSLDPKNRPADGEALAKLLFEWLQGKLSSAPAPRGRLVLASALAVTAILLALAGAFLANRPVTKPPTTVPATLPVTPPVAPPPPAKPLRSRRSARPPTPEQLAPQAILDELEGIVESPSIPTATLRRAQELTAELLREAPHDSRSLHYEALARFMIDGQELESRRGLLAAARASPPLDLRAVTRTVYFMRSLGFERAAAAVAEEACPGDRGVTPRLAGTLSYLYLTAQPPLADPARAEALATTAIESTTDRGERPTVFLWFATRAQARISLGRLHEAAADFDESARASRGGPYAGAGPVMLDRANECAAGKVPPDFGPRAFYLNFATTEFEGDVEGLNQRWRDWAPGGYEDAARGFLELADKEAARQRREHAAIAALRAGWVLERAHLDDRARDALERAQDLAQGTPLDTRALVARALANHLIERSLALERAETLASDATFEVPPGEPDARTDEELAEAWVLVARARLLRKDRAGARRALEQATSLDPADRRGVELVTKALGS
jgi:serine/threonine protein kinase